MPGITSGAMYRRFPDINRSDVLVMCSLMCELYGLEDTERLNMEVNRRLVMTLQVRGRS